MSRSTHALAALIACLAAIACFPAAHAQVIVDGTLIEPTADFCKNRSTRGCDARTIAINPGDDLLTGRDFGNEAIQAFGLRLDNKENLTFQDVALVEWISVRNESHAVRKLAIAVLADAWAMGLLDEDSVAIVSESLHLAMVSRDHAAFSAAISVALEHDLPLDADALLPAWQSMIDDVDQLRQSIASAFPESDPDQNERRLATHADRLALAMEKVSLRDAG